MILELLSYSFVQRAIISGMCAGILLAVLGIFVTLKRMSFFSDGVAHASLVGVALGLLFHREPLIYAVIFSVVFAIAIFFLEQKTTIATDSLLAILFTSSLALGIVLINLQSGFQPDLISYLFGNILTIRTFEVWLIAGLSVLIAGFIYWKYRTYLLLSLNEEVAALAGIHTKSYQLLLYVILAVATVLSIKVLGIMLVSALLIIPVSSAKLLAGSSRQLAILSILFSELAIILGMFTSLVLNLPVGSVIVLSATFLFILALVFKR
ncbi:MAG: hypothetical protein A3I29_00595 [Candidatus Magasanikbacteria bacterium RIFCSPLOWO2_02_FULL_44_11]|uniref:ABC transporter n=2 Tax=Candidatus Magasanikiibacteriota TaxID=1752731 RepID=A0A1F6N957_9BACT|nr:MAG: hypothetical protein A3D53_03820 [Candidatus Magasanikbacteria bacterium RIFCSPHIGHO2_02_FULL_45_10]OGH80434.1 MAG: hypothetical protein A3I29_00595 [Candidatus Magasanikbacteria bacterium RIFCSPLOWO2_02_FULL_44_11]